MNWRRTLFVWHRDVGFVAVGLTLVYAISGIAVNHRQHWDYNFAVTTSIEALGGPVELLGDPTFADGAFEESPGQHARREQARVVAALTSRLGYAAPPHKVFWRSPERLSLFFGAGDEEVVDYLPATGMVERQSKRARPLVRQVNFLHLNEGRTFWTYIADLFALALVFLALSGMVMVRGRHGLKGRGGVLMVAGVGVPLVAYLVLSL